MHLPVFHVDAFTTKPFKGNPAAVCPLVDWLDDALLRAVAAENNLSETAYLIKRGEVYELRWFTPICEVKLCGHATLAAGFVLMQHLAPERQSVSFETRYSGTLTVSREGDFFAMDFPALEPWKCLSPPQALIDGLKKTPSEVVQLEDNYFAVYEHEEDVGNIRPNLRMLEQIHPAGVAITAPGNDSDFVSRYFAPSYGIPEDPVTGSTHCSLAPYWSQQLGKTKLHARQISERGGELFCEVKANRVVIKGQAVLILRGELQI